MPLVVEALVNCFIVCQSYLLRAPDCRRTLTGTLYSGHPFLKPIISGFVESFTLQLITSLNGLEPLIVFLLNLDYIPEHIFWGVLKVVTPPLTLLLGYLFSAFLCLVLVLFSSAWLLGVCRCFCCFFACCLFRLRAPAPFSSVDEI